MKKKILFINPSLRQGGVEHSLITVLHALDPNKYEITLFIYTDMTDLISEVPSHVRLIVHSDRTRYFRKPYSVWKMLQYRIYGILGAREKAENARTEAYAYIHRLKTSYPARKIFGNEHFDIIVSYSLHIGTEMGLNINADRRFVLMHSSDPAYHKEIIERALGQYDHIVAVSKSVADIYRSNYPFLSDKIISINNYVDAERTLRLAHLPIELPSAKNKEWIFATCGRLSHEKGFDLAVNAAEILKTQGVSFLWLFIGDGAERERIERLIREKQLDHDILITGFQENPFPYINAGMIYVQPSYEEAQPLVLLEALILGKPIVSTSTVGGKTILEDGKKGLLTAVSAEGLAEGITALVTDAERRRSFENLYTLEDNLREKQTYTAAWDKLLSE